MLSVEVDEVGLHGLLDAAREELEDVDVLAVAAHAPPE